MLILRLVLSLRRVGTSLPLWLYLAGERRADYEALFLSAGLLATYYHHLILTTCCLLLTTYYLLLTTYYLLLTTIYFLHMTHDS